MNALTAKIVIVGIPLALSLTWFFFWVARLTRAGKKTHKPPRQGGS